MYEELVNKFVELRRNNDYYYHGRFMEEDSSCVKIDDVKIGILIINKSEVSYIRPMNRNSLMLLISKLDTIGDRMLMSTKTKMKEDDEKVNYQIKLMKQAIKEMD